MAAYFFGIIFVVAGSAMSGVLLLESKPCPFSEESMRGGLDEFLATTFSINCDEGNSMRLGVVGIILLGVGGFFCYKAHKLRRGEELGDQSRDNRKTKWKEGRSARRY